MSELALGYYRCTAKVERNARFPIHVMFAFARDWPERVLLQRGLLGNRRLEREPNDEETEIVANNIRAVSLRYECIEDLIEDERRCGTEETFIARLEAAFADCRRPFKLELQPTPTLDDFIRPALTT